MINETASEIVRSERSFSFMRFPSAALSLALWLVCSALSGTASAQAAPASSPEFTPAQRQAVEAIVKDYIAKHPEEVLDALQAAKDKMEKEAGDKASAVLATKKREVFNDPDSPVAGNPKGDVTMVEFFDYRCPYCKMVEPKLEQLLGADHGLRFVFKEFPILGADSETASRAALASVKQGKYEALHRALMALKGQIDDDAVMQTAASVGIDTKRLAQDMKSPDIERALQANLDLAEALDIHGTPAFIVGDQIVASAIGISSMKELIDTARHKEVAH
jgi:protein-disulfide isomerase